jgi:nucleoside-diphosphate-sugar epimerase
VISASRRALVLGATGHIGQAITRELLAHGWGVTAATRQPRAEALTGLEVMAVCGDADRAGQLAQWVPGHEAVFDAAAPYPMNLFLRGPGAERAPLQQAQRRMQSLLEAVGREGATLAHVSSFTALPRPPEESPLSAIESRVRQRLHPYFAVKAAMQALVLEAARGGLRAAVLNPAACLGPWDRRARELCTVPLLVSSQVPAMVSQPLNVIDVRDVARAARLAVEQQRLGEPIPLAGHDTRTDLLAARVCQLAGVRPPRRRLPVRVAAGAMLAAEAGWALLGRPSPVPALGSLLLLEGYAMQPSAPQLAMAVLPRALDETLRDSIDWYRSIGYC